MTPSGQTFSAGLAGWDGQESPEGLVGRADRALYAAKHAGRDRIVAATAQPDHPERIADETGRGIPRVTSD